MKYSIILLISIFSCITFSQQNFFNVPNSDITTKGDHFFQQQINFAPGDITNQITYDYGLGHGIEVGANIYNLVYESQRHTLSGKPTSIDDGGTGTMGLINAQKGIKLTPQMMLGIGAQTGRLINADPGNRLVHYEYANLQYKSASHFTGIVGVYNANEAYRGPGNGHFQLGFEFPVIHKKLHIVADYISGKSFISQLTSGVSYFPNRNFAISFGQQFSVRSNYQQSATVLEFTITPDVDLR